MSAGELLKRLDQIIGINPVPIQPSIPGKYLLILLHYMKTGVWELHPFAHFHTNSLRKILTST